MAPVVGDRLASFRLSGLDGTELSLPELLNRGPVVLFLFKTDCETSRMAVVFVERLWTAHRDHVAAEGTVLSVLGVSQDDAETTRRWRDESGFSFPVLLDRDLSVSRGCDLESTPTLLLLRGSEKLQTEAGQAPPEQASRIVDVVEGWSREGYALMAEDIAARIGALPADLWEGAGEVPEARPG